MIEQTIVSNWRQAKTTQHTIVRWSLALRIILQEKEASMQPMLYFFRLRDGGGIVITTDRNGSRLPLNETLGYKPGDWQFLEAVPSTELTRMITNVHEVEPALTDHGYYSLTSSQIIADHPFFKKYRP
jgi:hypothetical protein